MKNWPLRWQIALWAATTTGLALLFFGLIVAYQLYHEQIEAIDNELETAARFTLGTRAGGAAAEGGDLSWLAAMPKTEAPVFGYVLRRARDGAVLRAQPEGLAGVVAQLPAKGRRFVRDFDHTRLRLDVFSEGDAVLVLAAPLEPAWESVGDLLGAYAIAYPLALFVVAGGSWWLAGCSLGPFVRITAAAASITADRLGERLPVPPTDDEIGRHIRVLNGMFDRLQRSFEQATRFSADAAHELRTPLTIMRGQIEEALRSERLGPEQERLLVGLLEETTGLQKISDNLLLLARFDTGKDTLQLAPVDLSALGAEACEDAELLAAPRGIRVGADIAPGLRVEGDAVMLRRVLVNLVDNAVKYNRTGGEVRLALRADGGEAVFAVANTGPGIPAEQRGALFRRFFRPDSGRDRDSGGSGLGLSLCREIAVAHRGRIELVRSDDAWTEFSVRLPRLAG